MKTELRQDTDRLEALVKSSVREKQVVLWGSFNRKEGRVRLQAASTSTGRYALVFAEKLREWRKPELPGQWRH